MRGLPIKTSHYARKFILTSPSHGFQLAIEPKREKGRLRVAAIMAAGVEVFAEKGYDAATMTEVAARSKTAIGSLYRFFPTKRALADALLLQFAQQVKSGLNELREQVSGTTPERAADALVDLMLLLQSQRSLVLTLVDARGEGADERKRFRKMMRAGITEVLRSAVGDLDPARAKIAAVVIAHILKGVTNVTDEEPAIRVAVLAEFRELVRIYLVSLSSGSAG